MRGKSAYWLGFAIFGWGYMALIFWGVSGVQTPLMPTSQVLESIATKLNIPPAIGKFGTAKADPWTCFHYTGHCLWALLVGTLGGLLALGFTRLGARRGADIESLPYPSALPRRRTWLRPAAMALVGALAIVSLTLIAYPKAPELLSSMIYLATCVLVGLAIIGAIVGRKELRAEWLGMAIFAGGYLYVHFGNVPSGNSWSRYQPTAHVLVSIRPWLNAGVRVLHGNSAVKDAENQRILRALEEPISMNCANETPLEDVLKYIKDATKKPGYQGVPIYVDPVGLQEAEKTMTSPVTLDIERIPLKTTLRLMLKQLGLSYVVSNGMLTISTEPNEVWDVEDPYYLVGHSLLAWIAAGIGGVLATFVADPRRQAPREIAGNAVAG